MGPSRKQESYANCLGRQVSSPRMRRQCSFVLLMTFAVVATLGSETFNNEIVPEESTSSNGFPAEALVSPVVGESNAAVQSLVQVGEKAGVAKAKKKTVKTVKPTKKATK